MKTEDCNVTRFQKGDIVMLKENNNVNQIVDDTTKDWSCWDKVNYKWVNVDDLAKGREYINPNTNDAMIFIRHTVNTKSKFAVDSDGVVHIAQIFKQF